MTKHIWLYIIAIALQSSTAVADVTFNISSLSSPRIGFSAIEARSKVYFIGGFENGDLLATKTIEVYDLLAQNMSTPLQLDTPRAFVTPVVIEPNIYFVGGINYETPALVYDPGQRKLLNYGNGPSVVDTKSLSIYNSLMIRIGQYGVDILDMVLGDWQDPFPLRNLLLDMVDCAIFSEEGAVVVLGGVNGLTGSFSTSAWVYNLTSGEMHEYPDIVPEGFKAVNLVASYGSNHVIAVKISDSTLLHHLDRRIWRNTTFSSLAKMVSLPDKTFLTTGANLATFDWNDPSGQLVYELDGSDASLRHLFLTNGTAFYIVADQTSMLIRAYDVNLKGWIATTTFSPASTVGRSIDLEGGWHVFETGSGSVYGYYPAENALSEVQNVNFAFGISSLIPAEEPDQLYIFELGRITKTQFTIPGAVNSLEQQPCALTAVARIGSDFLDAQGRVMSVNDLTHFVDLNITLPNYLKAFNSEYFAVVGTNVMNSARFHYKRVDIYNFITGEWSNSTDMPTELTDTGFAVQWFYSAAALDNKLVVWMNTVMAVYDPITSNWTTYTNYTQSTVNNVMTDIHIPVPIAQGLAFMRTNNNTLDVFSPSTFPSWTSTSPAPDVEQSIKYVFQQCIVRNNSQLFITSISISLTETLHNTLYIYDVLTGEWTYDQLPNALTATAVPIIVFAGDYLLSMTNGILSYLDLTSRNQQEQNLPFKFSPAIAIETSANVTFIAGGRNEGGSYSNRIMIIPHNAITFSTPNGNMPTVQPFTQVNSGLSDGELIAAIVVPIGVVLIGAALLVFFLVRRSKRRRRQGNASNTIGLAGKYGQWFIPFETIKFGDQLGQGASGQVFKGTWNSTTVALKVSMTQANSSVISELELMMQLRPHPNVIQLFGFSVHPETDSIILVIEYCNGGSLDDTLFDAKQSVSIQQKISWLIGMAKGLEHLHANNIVHRDIAARNVLLHQNEPKITDFGMSRLIDEDKQRGTTKSELGPIRWMSPESLRNKEYSNKSDVWSFGVLMYEVIAQSEPHIDRDPIEIGRLIRDNGLTPSIPSSCPSELAQLMKQCWDMTPDKRVSIDQIVQRLEAMQHQ